MDESVFSCSDSLTQRNMPIPVSCVSMIPLFNARAKLFICTINSLKPISVTRNIFVHPNGLPINKVEVMGFVTEIIRKEDCYKLELQDGTGEIKCIISKNFDGVIRCPFGPNLAGTVGDLTKRTLDKYISDEMRTLSTDSRSRCIHLSFLKSILQEQNLDDIVLGDLLLIRGHLESVKWSGKKQIICDKLHIVRKKSLFDELKNWTLGTVKLHDKIYSRNPALHQEIFKKGHKKDCEIEIANKLSEKITSGFTEHVLYKDSSFTQFNGYEALQFEFIVNIFDNYYQEIKENVLKDEDFVISSNWIKYTSLINALHTFVVSGELIKQKSLYQITGKDQLDSLYHVTRNCQELLNIIQHVPDLHEWTSGSSQKISEDTSFGFILNSKHYPAIKKILSN